MAELQNAKAQLLDCAESFIQTRGFNDFSFRDLADQVGISSASVHHHYRTKEDLGIAVTARYTERFVAALNDEAEKNSQPKKLLSSYIKMFRNSLVEDGRMCLCGMLGAEIESLPQSIANEAKTFFEKNILWLSGIFKLAGIKSNAQANLKAKFLLATLEGAMILSRTNENNKLFDDVTNNLVDSLLDQ